MEQPSLIMEPENKRSLYGIATHPSVTISKASQSYTSSYTEPTDDKANPIVPVASPDTYCCCECCLHVCCIPGYVYGVIACPIIVICDIARFNPRANSLSWCGAWKAICECVPTWAIGCVGLTKLPQDRTQQEAAQASHVSESIQNCISCPYYTCVLCFSSSCFCCSFGRGICQCCRLVSRRIAHCCCSSKGPARQDVR